MTTVREELIGLHLEIFPSNYLHFPGRKRKWYVRLKAKNGETLNTSQGFATKWNAKRSARRIFPTLDIEYLD